MVSLVFVPFKIYLGDSDVAEKTRLDRVRTNNVLCGVYDTEDDLKEPKGCFPTFSEDIDISGELFLPLGAVILQYVGYEVAPNPDFVIILDNRLEVLGDGGYSEDLDLQPLDYETVHSIPKLEEATPKNCFSYAKMGRRELDVDPDIGFYAASFGISSARLSRLIFGRAPRRIETELSERDTPLTSHP